MKWEVFTWLWSCRWANVTRNARMVVELTNLTPCHTMCSAKDAIRKVGPAVVALEVRHGWQGVRRAASTAGREGGWQAMWTVMSCHNPPPH